MGVEIRNNINNTLGLNGLNLSKDPKTAEIEAELPENPGLARESCRVPDFNDPNRPKTVWKSISPLRRLML